MIRAGLSRLSGSASPPSSVVSSSWKILTICWPGVTLRSTSWPSAFSLTRAMNVLGHLEMHVGLQQREAHLAHGVVDVGFADRPVAAQVLENVLELVAELGKHVW